MKFGARVNEAETDLRKWLESGALKEGQRLPSARELAKELGKTHYSVNAAITALVHHGELKRDGYKLFYRRSEPTVFQATCRYLSFKTSPLLKVSQRVAAARGIRLEVEVYDAQEEAKALLQRALKTEVDRVFFEVPFHESEVMWLHEIEELLARRIPCVCLGATFKELPSARMNARRGVALAMAHLTSLGHSELALISYEARTPSAVHSEDAWDVNCRERNLFSSRDRICWRTSLALKQDLRKFAERFCGEWSCITGLVILDRAVAPALIQELRKVGRRVPRDISILCLGDAPGLKTSDPPITTVAFDIELQIRGAFEILDLMVKKRSSPIGPFSTPQITIEPELIVRSSTAKVTGSFVPEAEPDKQVEIICPEPLPSDPKALSSFIEQVARRPYPMTTAIAAAQFHPLDLRSFVNRPLQFRRGWLGEYPLHGLPPGMHHIHGIYFQISGGPTREDCGAVVFRSLRNSLGNHGELPCSVQIDVNMRARAIYVLHGCGYVNKLSQVAEYSFVGESDLLGTVPLIALGQSNQGANAKDWSAALEKANIQDWWPNFPQSDFPHAKRVIVSHEEENLQFHRYLYTLEWINPKPEEIVRQIVIKGAPQESYTLGLLAISLLKG